MKTASASTETALLLGRRSRLHRPLQNLRSRLSGRYDVLPSLHRLVEEWAAGEGGGGGHEAIRSAVADGTRESVRGPQSRHQNSCFGFCPPGRSFAGGVASPHESLDMPEADDGNAGPISSRCASFVRRCRPALAVCDTELCVSASSDRWDHHQMEVTDADDGDLAANFANAAVVDALHDLSLEFVDLATDLLLALPKRAAQPDEHSGETSCFPQRRRAFSRGLIVNFSATVCEGRSILQ